MISLDKCKELLDAFEGVTNAEVCRDKFVRGQFANPVNAKEPHSIVLHPTPDNQLLRVVVPSVTRLKSDSVLHRIFCNWNYDKSIGKVCVDNQDGEVQFVINHACQDGQVEDPSPEVVNRLIDVAVKMAKELTILVTFWGMREAGVPEELAKKFIDQFQLQDSGEEDEQTL